MKLKNTFLCASALFAFALIAEARYEGSYMNEITMNYESPHFDWMKNPAGGPVRAFIITPATNARDIVELQQRLALDSNIVVIHPDANPAGNGYGATDAYTTPIEGTMPQERKAELLKNFPEDGGNYEVVVLNLAGNFNRLPPELKVRIMKFVRNGGGLLLTGGVPWQDMRGCLPKKFIQDMLPEEKAAFDLANPSGRLFQAARFGKGRIALLSNSKEKNDPDVLGQWWTNHESNQVPFINALLWASGRNPGVKITQNPKRETDQRLLNLVNAFNKDEKNKNHPIDLSEKNAFGTRSVTFNAEGEGKQTFAYRIRNNDNRIIFEGKTEVRLEKGVVTPVLLTFPQLEDGKFALDIQAVETSLFGKDKVKAVACFPFEIASPVGKSALDVPASVSPGKPFEAVLRIGKPLPEAGTMEVVLTDSPYRRIWYKGTAEFPKGYSGKIRIQDYHMPTRAGILAVTLKNAKGERLTEIRKEVFFPSYDLETFLEFGDSTTNPLIAPQMIDAGNRWRNGLWGGKTSTLLNQRVLPWATNIQIQSTKTDEITYPNLTSDKPDSLFVTLKGDLNPYKPEMRDYWKKTALTRSNLPESRNWGAVIYNLGDECGFSRDAGYGEFGDKAYRDFLKRHYGNIENLNAKWGSSYPSFDKVPHAKRNDTRKDPAQYPLWLAQTQYTERMYADLMHFLSDEIRRLNPNAKVGAEGSQGGDLEYTISKLGFWGPYQDKVEGELLRSIGGDRVRTFWWGGYIGMHGGRQGLPVPLWTNLLRGTYDGHMWFQCSPGGSMSYLGSDYTFAKYYKDMQPSMNALTNGLAQTIITTPFANTGDILLFHSHVSNLASELDTRFHTADMATQIIDYFYERGLNFRFVTKNSLKELKKAKIVFLTAGCALSESEINALREFVKDGGVLVAGINPGLMNESFKLHTENPMKDLFGNIVHDKISEPRTQKASIDLKLGNETIRFQSNALKSIPELDIFQIRKVGKGTAILLNFSLSNAYNSQKEKGMFNSMFDSVLKYAGVVPKYKIETEFPMNQRMFRIRSGSDYELIGMLALMGDTGKNGVLTLPNEKFVYEVQKGLLGKTDTVKVHFDVPFKMYAAFDSEQKAPLGKLSSGRVEQGKSVILDLAGNRKDGIYFLQLFDAGGKLVPLRDQVIEMRKGESVPLFFSYNDPKGQYTFELTDVLTGLKSRFNVELQ